MQKHLICLIIILVLGIVIFFRFKIKTKIFYDLLKNRGSVKLSFFKLTLSHLKISLVKKHIKLVQKNQKEHFLPLSNVAGIYDFFNELQLQLLHKLKLKHAYIFINVGLENNAFATSMTAGYTKAFTSTILMLLSFKKKGVKIIDKVYPKFDKNVFSIEVKTKITLSIFDFLLSVLKAYLKRYKILNKAGKKNDLLQR